jgi:hypothetical protein
MARKKARGPHDPEEPEEPQEPSRWHIQDDAGRLRPADAMDIELEAIVMGGTFDDEGWLAFLDDPALFGPGSARVPAALFEPRRAMMGRLPGASKPTESQVEAAVLAGLGRVDGSAPLAPARGWTAVLAGGHLGLTDHTGGPWSRIEASPTPEWLAAATEHSLIVCLYGPMLGVRCPPESSPATWSATARAEELRRARGLGMVAGGIIGFRQVS